MELSVIQKNAALFLVGEKCSQRGRSLFNPIYSGQFFTVFGFIPPDYQLNWFKFFRGIM